jgi:hypothetical protein
MQLEMTMRAEDQREAVADFQHFVRGRNHENRIEIRSFRGGILAALPRLWSCGLLNEKASAG